MLCQLKTDSLLLNVKENISQEQQSQHSDEIKKEKGFQETGWIKRVFCSVLYLFFFPSLLCWKEQKFSCFAFCVFKFWYCSGKGLAGEESEFSLKTLIFSVNAAADSSKFQMVLDFL